MKFRIDYKSKKTIIAIISLVILFVAGFAGGYAWIKSNDQSTAVTNETLNNDSQSDSEGGNNQVTLPNLGDEEENSSENADDNQGDNSSNTTSNETSSNNSPTGTTSTEDATIVIEQVVVGEKLVAEDSKIRWIPEVLVVPETDLSLTKSDLTVIKKAETQTSKLTGNNLVQTGEIVNYTIEITNNGAETLNKIEVSDIIPEGTTFESVEDETATLVKETTGEGKEVVTKIIWTVDVEAGKTVAVKFAVKVNEKATGTITNIAIANGEESQEQHLAIIEAEKTAVINNNPEIKKAKIGDEITYTISIKNTGDIAGNILVKDEDLADILENRIDVENIIEKAELVGAIKINGQNTEYLAEDLIDTGINVLVEANQTATVVFTVKVKEIEGSISNAALIGNGGTPTEPEEINTVNITAVKENNKGNTGTEVVKVGDEIVYTIKLSNSGNIAGTTTVTDTLPTGVTFLEASEGGVYSNGKVIWKDIEVLPGTDTVTLTVKVKANESVTGRITNTVEVEGEETTDGGLDTTNITFIKKNNDEDKVVKVGDEIEYEIILSNSGSVTGTTTVVDTLPEGVTFKSATDNGVYSNGVVTWENVEVPVGTNSKTVKVVVAVESDATGKIENTATVEGKSDTDEGVNTTNITATKTNKDTDKVVKVGDSLQYEITLTNSGNTSGKTTVVDTLPAELKFVSASIRPTNTQTIDGKTVLTWENVSVAGNNGIKTITINTTVKSVSSKKIINTAKVEGNTITDEGVDTVGLTIKKKNNDVDGEVKVGDPIQYEITLKNSGSIPMTTTVTDTLPKELEYISAKVQPDTVEPKEDGTTLLTWNAVNVSNTQPTIITINTRVKSVSNKEIVNTATADGVPESDKGVDTVNITAVKTNKDKDGKVKVGDTVEYEIKLTNRGTVTGDTKVVDILPAEITYVSAEIEPNKIEKLSDGRTKLIWNSVEVLTTKETIITISTKIESASDKKILNSVTVEGTTTTDTGVDIVNITATKKNNDTDGVAKVGDEILYTIELSNSGNIAGTTTVTDILPEGVTFLEASEGGVYSNEKVIWEDIEVVPGTNTVTLTVKVTVNEEATERITNKVEVEGNETTDGGLDTVNITASKVNNDIDGEVEIGDSLSYTITLTNSGNVAGTTTVIDTLPKQLKYNPEGTTPAPDTVIEKEDGTTVLTWNNVNVATSEPTIITVDSTVKSGSANKIKNTVTVEGKDYKDEGVDFTGMVATKKVDKLHAEYGDILTYEIEITSQSAKQQTLAIKDKIDTTKVEFVPGSITVDDIKQPDSLYSNGIIAYNGTITGIGTKVVLKFKVKVISTAVGETINNTAIVNDTINTDTTKTTITKEVKVRFDALTEHPLDVILVLDTSGSMEDHNRMTNLRGAAEGIVEVLFPVAQDTGSTISLIEFASGAELLGTYKGSERAKLLGTNNTKGVIDRLVAGGSTNEYAALEETLELLNKKNADGTKVLSNKDKLVIFLSDGAATTGSAYNQNYAGGLIDDGYYDNNASGYDDNTRENIENKAKQIQNISGVTVYSVGLGIDSLETGDRAWVESCNPIEVNEIVETDGGKATFKITISNYSNQEIVIPTISADLVGIESDTIVVNSAINSESVTTNGSEVIWTNVRIPAGSRNLELTLTADREKGFLGGYKSATIEVSHSYVVDEACINTEHKGIPFTGTITHESQLYHYMDTKAWGTYTLSKIASSAATFEKVEDSDDVTALKSTFEKIIREKVSGTEIVYADKMPVVIRYDETHSIIGDIIVHIGEDTYSVDEVEGLVYTPGEGFVWTINDTSILNKELLITYAY